MTPYIGDTKAIVFDQVSQHVNNFVQFFHDPYCICILVLLIASSFVSLP